MSTRIKKVCIVGGGTAGWLSAGILASRFTNEPDSGLEVYLVESPDVATIGVGEGTWPSMRTTLQRIGVSETEFIKCCDVSLKQGTRFNGWANDNSQDYYYHPFSLPQKFGELDLVPHWQNQVDHASFAEMVSPQARLCDEGRAAKQIQTPEYAFNVNYGYHLNAGKFAEFLADHCRDKLGVKHLLDHVVQVNAADDGDIISLSTRDNGDLAADLFIDCTGQASLLLGEHFSVPFQSVRDVLFNDTAYATQAPYTSEQEPIASCTIATAQNAGWIWDIGLPNRRGVGYVCSSQHTSQEMAETELHSYLCQRLDKKTVDQLTVRQIKFNPGYRDRFWVNNCVAVGLSAGFVEPLEASALVLVEKSAAMIADQFPVNREAMGLLADRFNQRFQNHWDNIIKFLKLHYVLSNRENGNYWADHRINDSCPEELTQMLKMWHYQSPWLHDAPRYDELFPAASYQYVLYGMGFKSESSQLRKRSSEIEQTHAHHLFKENKLKTEKLVNVLPTNRELLEKVHQQGFRKIH